MMDRYIVFADGSRVWVSHLTIQQIHECIEDIQQLEPKDGTSCTKAEILDRLQIELVIRGLGAN